MTNICRERLLGQRSVDDKISVADVILVIAVILLIAITALKAFVFSPVQVSGSSMETTVQDGDWLIMRKTHNINYGDVIIVRTSGSGDSSVYYIKRVIGLPGDTVYTLNGEVYRKKSGQTVAEKIDEPYARYLDNVGGTWIPSANEGTYAPPSSDEDVKECVVGEGEVYFMGDNRKHSRDSREIGTRKISDVIGVVDKWSINKRHFYSRYFNFSQRSSNAIKKIFGR